MKKRKLNLLLGILGNFFFMLGDWLWQFKLPGMASETIGLFVERAWLDMPLWRFILSAILGAAGTPLYYIGFKEMYGILKEQVREKKFQKYVKLFHIGYLSGTMFFIYTHAICMVISMVFKCVYNSYGDVHTAAEIANNILVYNAVPFLSSFFFADVFLSIAMILLICKGTLPIGKWAVLCNPLVSAMLGNLLALLPWPINQIDPATESFGHLLILLIGYSIVRHEVPKSRTNLHLYNGK